MEQLKDFMLLFRFALGNEPPTQEQEDEMHQQWSRFIGSIASRGQLVSTHQLGFAGVQIAPSQTVTEGIHMTDKYTMAGNMVLKAASIEEATELARKCPILAMGGTVEVRDIIPMNQPYQ